MKQPIKRSLFDKLIKYSLLVLLSPVIVFACLWIGSVAEARGFQHHHQTAPNPIVNRLTTSTSPIVNQPPTASTLQFGFFLPPSNAPSQWTMRFTATTFPSGSGNVVIFLEPPFTDSQILNGQFDSQLETFAVAASHYSGQVVLALGEEVNCNSGDPWEIGVGGNTVASTIAAFQHESSIVKSIAPNVKRGLSLNNADCGTTASLQSFYPGDAYVDLVLVDGFDFGGQTWDQVFDSALTQANDFGKPVWIGSEGVTASDNQSAFLRDTYAGAAKYGVPVVMYFNQSPFNLSSAAISTLQSLAK
jgi:hypothetical protein